MRKVLLHPDRNGRLYMLDRATGEVLSAEPYAYINSNRGVDLKTGELLRNDEYKTGTDKTVRDICPTASGAKDWNPSAFSPRTGYLYIPHNNLCMDHRAGQVSYIAGTPYVGAEVKQKAGPGGYRGEFDAWDVAGEKKVWSLQEKFPVWSGALATAGDVVFYGNMEGWFKAVDAHDGNLLWQFKTGSGIIGQPTTYKGPDGHQYVAILSGRWRLVRRHRFRRPRSSRRHRRPRFRERHDGPARRHHQGRHALCLPPAIGLLLRCIVSLLPRSDGGGARPQSMRRSQ